MNPAFWRTERILEMAILTATTSQTHRREDYYYLLVWHTQLYRTYNNVNRKFTARPKNEQKLKLNQIPRGTPLLLIPFVILVWYECVNLVNLYSQNKHESNNLTNLNQVCESNKLAKLWIQIHLSIEGMQFHHLWICNKFWITLNPSEWNCQIFVSVR